MRNFELILMVAQFTLFAIVLGNIARLILLLTIKEK